MNPFGATICDNAFLPTSHEPARQQTLAEMETEWIAWRREALGRWVRVTTDQAILDGYRESYRRLGEADWQLSFGELLRIVEVPRHFEVDEHGEVQHLIGGGPIAEKCDGRRVALGTGLRWEFV